MVGDDRPLLLPFFGGLDLAVAAAEAVAEDEVAVDVVGACQTGDGSELVDIACLCGAIVNLDTFPSAGRLCYAGRDRLLYGVKPIIR